MSCFFQKTRTGFLFVLFGGIIFSAAASASEKVNLGPNINSRYDELAPVFSPDGKVLYFCREGDPRNTGYESHPDDQDIWVSYRQPDGQWGPARHIAAMFNSAGYDFPIGTSADGKTLYIGNVYSPDGSVHSGISYTRFNGRTWSWPKKLEIHNMYNQGKLVNYYMSPDEKSLLLNLQRADSLGKLDIYVSFLQEDGTWSEPFSLKSTINSIHQEVTPFLARDLKTLYFSSNRPGGFGGYDVYMARRLDDTWTKWTKPVNLGPEINTPGHDINYVISPSGEYAIFSSETARNRKDLFRVPLPKNMRPNRAVFIKGIVTDPRNKPLSAKVYAERISDGKLISMTRSDSSNGRYVLNVSAGEVYSIRASREGYIPISSQVDLRSVATAETRRNLVLAPIKKGQKIKLNNIFFEYNSAQLKKESFPELDRLARLLAVRPTMKIRLEGHTDNKGSSKYNMKLSADRAKAVKNYLVQKGIPASRIQVKGFGETKPLKSNSSAEGRKFNRRVEFRILSM